MFPRRRLRVARAVQVGQSPPMGSTCEVLVDGFDCWGSRSYVDDATLSIFHERDRQRRVALRPQYGSGSPEPLVVYAVGAQEMRERLDAMGFTVAHARADYARGLSEEYEALLSPGFGRDDRERVRQWSYDRWCAAVGRLVPRGFQVWATDAFADDHDAERLGDDGRTGLGSYFSDLRHLLRGLLDALPDAREVVLDVTDLIGAGYYGDDEPICDEARRGWAHDHSLQGPILLLTEGRSDTRILKAAFEAMAPHLADLYGFLDFEGLRLEGSADVLAKTVRSFVAARVGSRVVAVFDNDTAGLAAMAGLASVDLPDHVRIMALPENGLGRSYPTIGPQGIMDMDVNGMACGIEMYLGLDALSDGSGAPRPVRWTGYDPRMGRYQGAVGDKSGVEARFLDRLASCANPPEARRSFPELARIVDAVVGLFTTTPPRSNGPRENLSDR